MHPAAVDCHASTPITPAEWFEWALPAFGSKLQAQAGVAAHNYATVLQDVARAVQDRQAEPRVVLPMNIKVFGSAMRHAYMEQKLSSCPARCGADIFGSTVGQCASCAGYLLQLGFLQRPEPVSPAWAGQLSQQEQPGQQQQEQQQHPGRQPGWQQQHEQQPGQQPGWQQQRELQLGQEAPSVLLPTEVQQPASPAAGVAVQQLATAASAMSAGAPVQQLVEEPDAAAAMLLLAAQSVEDMAAALGPPTAAAEAVGGVPTCTPLPKVRHLSIPERAGVSQ